MNVEIDCYPDNWSPFTIIPEARHKITLLIKDRNGNSTIRINTHYAGLEQLISTIDKGFDSLNKKESSQK